MSCYSVAKHGATWRWAAWRDPLNNLSSPDGEGEAASKELAEEAGRSAAAYVNDEDRPAWCGPSGWVAASRRLRKPAPGLRSLTGLFVYEVGFYVSDDSQYPDYYFAHPLPIERFAAGHVYVVEEQSDRGDGQEVRKYLRMDRHELATGELVRRRWQSFAAVPFYHLAKHFSNPEIVSDHDRAALLSAAQLSTYHALVLRLAEEPVCAAALNDLLAERGATDPAALVALHREVHL